jgi:methyl-accepting chemotaxis protein
MNQRQSDDTQTEGVAQTLETRLLRFQTTFMKVASGAIMAMSATIALVSLRQPDAAPVFFACIVGATGSATAFGLVHTGRLRLGGHLFLTLVLLAATVAVIAKPNGSSIPVVGTVTILLAVFAAFIHGTSATLIYGGAGAVGLSLVMVGCLRTTDEPVVQLTTNFIVALGSLGAAVASLTLFLRLYRTNMEDLQRHTADIDRVIARARRIAEGDLSGDIDGDTDVSVVVRSMLEGLRSMVKKLRDMLNGLASATSEIAAMARQQEQGAVSQVSAVEDIGKTLSEHADMSRAMTTATEEVFDNVAQTKQTNELISDRIGTLTAQTQRISEILEIIKDVANKSEILALNASLEGAKAGEAGAGFSLVANQMQRLAESVSLSVKDVRELTSDIRDATRATVVSTEQGTKLATSATEAVHEISLVTKKQQKGTEQVSASINDIVEVSNQMLAGSSQTLSAIKDLTRMSQEMNQLLASYDL